MVTKMSQQDTNPNLNLLAFRICIWIRNSYLLIWIYQEIFANWEHCSQGVTHKTTRSLTITKTAC